MKRILALEAALDTNNNIIKYNINTSCQVLIQTNNIFR